MPSYESEKKVATFLPFSFFSSSRPLTSSIISAKHSSFMLDSMDKMASFSIMLGSKRESKFEIDFKMPLINLASSLFTSLDKN